MGTDMSGSSSLGQGFLPSSSSEIPMSESKAEFIRQQKEAQLSQLRVIFGEMLEEAPFDNPLKGHILKPNATTDEELKAVISKGKHKASCICKCAGFCGSWLPCTACTFWQVISPDELELVSHSGFAELMFDGTHRLKSCRQSFNSRIPRNKPYIQFRNLHIVSIPKGYVGLASRDNAPILLGAGRHCFFDPLFVYHDHVPLNQSPIINGSLHIISVGQGELAYGFESSIGHPRIFSEGLHVVDRPGFRFGGIIDLNKPRQTIGSLELVRIETGDVGVAYRGGKLCILEPGLHLLVPPDRFHAVLSTQQTVVSLPVAVHESGDYVPLRVKADVFYSISDPYKAVTMVDDIPRTIRETAAATLAGIIRASTLQDIAKSSKPTHGKGKVFTHSEPEEKKAPGAAPEKGGPKNPAARASSSAPIFDALELMTDPQVGKHEHHSNSFYSYVHDRFIADLHDDCKRKWGIELQNIRIESLTIDDAPLAHQISQQSLIYATTQAKLANLESSRCIKETEAARDAVIQIRRAEANKTVAELRAKASAAAITIRSNATAERQEIEAQAYAKQVALRSEAQAKATVELARAERKRLELNGQGRREFNEHIEATDIGSDFLMLREQVTALAGSRKMYFTGSIPEFWTDDGTRVAAGSATTVTPAVSTSLRRAEK